MPTQVIERAIESITRKSLAGYCREELTAECIIFGIASSANVRGCTLKIQERLYKMIKE